METKIIQRHAGGGEDPDNIDNIEGIPIKDHAGEPVTLVLREGVYWLQSHIPNCCEKSKPGMCICDHCMRQGE